MGDKIHARFFSEAFSKLFSDKSVPKTYSSGFHSSASKYSFYIPPSEYFNLSKEFEIHNEEISHFTTLRGLFSILNSESIRLYNLDNMNDPTEYSYALENEYKSSLERKKSEIYVLSTCLFEEMSQGEKFSMWNNYGESGFGARLILDYSEGTKFELNSSFLKRVKYSKLNLTKFLEAKTKIEIEEKIPPIDFLDTIKTPCILHKNQQYELEKEVRLVYLNEYGEDNPNLNYDPECNFFSEYSYTSNKLCKYYNLKLNDKKSFANLKIKKIILGSKHLENSAIFNELRLLCYSKQNRIGTTGISISKINHASY